MQGFDYTSTAQYSITICTYLKEPFLGRIDNENIMLSEIGKTVQESWVRLGSIYRGVEPGTYAVMPNHFHGIISMSKQCGGDFTHLGLPEIIRNFKAFTAHACYTAGINRKLWQRGYYEHIIRDEKDLDRIETYINDNPSIWSHDKYYLL
jgi:putative transposase